MILHFRKIVCVPKIRKRHTPTFSLNQSVFIRIGKGGRIKILVKTILYLYTCRQTNNLYFTCTSIMFNYKHTFYVISIGISTTRFEHLRWLPANKELTVDPIESSCFSYTNCYACFIGSHLSKSNRKHTMRIGC